MTIDHKKRFLIYHYVVFGKELRVQIIKFHSLRKLFIFSYSLSIFKLFIDFRKRGRKREREKH